MHNFGLAADKLLYLLNDLLARLFLQALSLAVFIGFLAAALIYFFGTSNNSHKVQTHTMQLSHQSGITLPITSEFRHIADAFATQCPIQEKADQIRRNTLAVCAVNFYLQLMDIPTQVEKSDSWQPMMQMMGDVADLQVPGVGLLSCRSVLPGEETCYVPPEDWRDRAGHIAVVLNDQTATLVGFTETVGEQTQVALSQFAPIEMLIDKVHSLQTVAATDSAATQATVTRLSRWVGAQIDELAKTGWQAVDRLLNPAQVGLVFRKLPDVDVSRAKRVNLGIRLGESVRVALVMQLTQVAANEAEATPQTYIVLQVRPLDGLDRLPAGLLLSALDDEAVVVASATSRAIDDYIQLEVSGEAGEQFGIRLALGEASFEEQFAI